MKNLRLLVLAVALTSSVAVPVVARADVYMQHPRGDNNRLNEASSSSGSVVVDLILWLFG